MTKFNLDDDRTRFLSRVVDFLTGFDEVVAVGLSGSGATGNMDRFSDLDVCVYTKPDLPEAKTRRERLESAGLGEIQYFDVDFEVSRGDGLSLNGKRCDLNWMSVPKVELFLKSLVVDFDCNEFLPGGLLMTKDIYDPNGLIEHLQKAVPAYSPERSMHRIKKSVSAAHFSLYVLCWLEKAAARNDYFSFLKFKFEILDHFFTALFALNRQWFCQEKRLVEMVDRFPYAPSSARTRLTEVIVHSGTSSSLGESLKEIKSLFSELVGLSVQAYPGLELPSEWR